MKNLIKHTAHNHHQPLFYSLAVFLLLALSLISFGREQIKGFATSISVDELTTYTNQYRIENGLKPLSVNPTLNQAAQDKARHMAANGYWDHTAPDGTTPWYFIDQTGFEYYKAGENLAHGFDNSEATVKAWWKSDSHRANILDDDYDEVGFAFVNIENYQGSDSTLVVALYADVDGAVVLPNRVSGSNETGNAGEINILYAALNGQTDRLTNWILIISSITSFGYIKKHYKHAVNYVHKGEAILKTHPMLEASLLYLAILAIISTSYGAIL